MGFLKHFRPCVDDCAECKPNPCDSCCPGFTVEYRSRSATKTKCGFEEFGTPSTPPKIYRTVTFSGQSDYEFHADLTCTSCEDAQRVVFSGSSTFSRPACEETQTGNAALYGNGDCSYAFVENQAITIGDMVGYNFGSTGIFSYGVSSPTLRYVAVSDLSCIPYLGTNSQKYYSTGQEQLSDEYTTSQLFSDTETAVTAASWSSWSTTPTSALYDLSTDELTITLRDLEVRVLFSEAAPSGCKLEYDLYSNGVFSAHYCFALTPGATSFTGISADHPALGSPGNLTFENFEITSGAC